LALLALAAAYSKHQYLATSVKVLLQQ